MGRAPRRLPKALELYRRLIAEHTKSESEWVDDARAWQSTRSPATSVDVGTPQTFLPDSEQEILLAWRNTKQIELTLYAVDLTRDARWEDRRNWIDTIAVEGKPVVRRWTYDTNDAGDHRPGHAAIRVTPRLPMGAYILTARSGKETRARTLMLVTDAHILVHAAGGRVHIFVSDVETGEPIAGARVRITRGTT